MKPPEVLSLTPREFTILMKAQQERKYDEYEGQAYEAIMHENASRIKRPKITDLFKRPTGKAKDKRMSTKELREYTEQQQALLSQFTFAKSNG